MSPVMTTAGSGLTVTVAFALATQLSPFVTVTLYVVVAVGLTVMLGVVAPLLQMYEVPPLAVNVVLSPTQISLSPVMTTAGSGLTVTVALALATQLSPFVTVTLYVVVVVGLTVMLAVVAPLLHI
jgi:hypothetical protein